MERNSSVSAKMAYKVNTWRIWYCEDIFFIRFGRGAQVELQRTEVDLGVESKASVPAYVEIAFR